MNGKNIIKVLICLFTAITSAQVQAQTISPGFVQEDVVKQSGATNDSLMYLLSSANRQTTRAFVDGLGRGIQTVAVQASPLQNDIIQPVAYDNLGRQTKAYLGYAGQSTDVTGSYRFNAISTAQPAFYNQTSQYLIASDTAAYSRVMYENTPLQRLLETGSIGTGFQPVAGQHFKTISYRPNSNALDGNIANTGTTGVFTAYYADGALWVTDGKDEDNEETLIFKNLAGQVVLKRQVTGQTAEPYFDTYYIYNNAGAVKYIVPPKATHLIFTNGYTLSTPAVSNLIYAYQYNNIGLVTAKKAPGSGTTYIIYDPLNRPVLVQDTLRSLAHQWYYVKYDAKGRVIITGTYINTAHTTPASMQTYVSGLTGYSTTWYESKSTSATQNYYTNSVFPTVGSAMTYNYYDNYDWNDDGNPDYSYIPQSFTSPGPEGQTIPAPVLSTDSLKGMPTITMTLTVGPGLSNMWLMKVMFYDNYGRVIQTRSNNQINYMAAVLTDSKTVAPDFIGKAMATRTIVVTGSGTGNTNTINTTYNYDTGNSRLADVDQQYNAQANVHIAHYNYNEIGQLIAKNLAYSTAASKYLQTEDFRYSIRGQLLYINNSKLNNDGGVTNADSTDLFGMQILYDKIDANLGTYSPSYDGKITAVKWMTRNGGDSRVNERSYVYSYDLLDRDTSATYAERLIAGTSTFNRNQHGFDENGITYDDAGNMQKLKRTSSSGVGATSHTAIDNLSYTYDTTKPNQLNGVADATGNNLGFTMIASSSGSYSYDQEGNLTADPYKGLSLKYNVFNRVDSITRTASGTGGAYITYTYDATGNMLRKQVWSSSTTLQTTTDYIDGFVYTTVSGTTTISYLSMPEGRVVNTATTGVTLTPEYVFTDQQGNARFSFQDSGSGTVKIIQENSFYAFGEGLAGSTVAPLPTTPNINLYNGGSEWQSEFNNLPDYHQTFFRNYDPAIGRFTASDPQPESTVDMTTYQYAGNNPVMMNDPDGDLAKFGVNNQVRGFGGRMDEFDVQNVLNAYEGNYSTYDAEGVLEGFDDPYGGGNGGYGQNNGNANAGSGGYGIGNPGQDIPGASFQDHAIEQTLQYYASIAPNLFYNSNGITKYWTYATSGTDGSNGATAYAAVVTTAHTINLGGANQGGVQDIRNNIVSVAESYNGSNAWGYNRAKDNFPAGCNKCNLYVYDVLKKAGASPGLPHNHGTNPPTAADWANPFFNIPGWIILRSNQPAMPGDIVAVAENFSDATGHVGIVIGPNLTSSFSSYTQQVTQNDWGFRSDNGGFTFFRRYVGP